MKNLRRLWLAFLLVLFLCLVAVVYRIVTGDERFATLLVSLIFTVFAFVCGWIAYRTARAEKLPKGLRWGLGLLFAYHALAGPVFILYFLLVEVSTNQDLPHRIYPHIVGFVNSLM